MVVVTAIGVPVEEALASIGMITSDAVVHLEYNGDVKGIPAAMAESFPTQQCSRWAEAGMEENLAVDVDWLIAVYPVMPTPALTLGRTSYVSVMDR